MSRVVLMRGGRGRGGGGLHRRVCGAVLAFALAGAPAALAPGAHRATRAVAGTARPSIVVIMVDDLAPMDGRLYRYLPTIRSLFVDQGVQFADFHGETPLCCPGRVGYLTGQHTRNHGVPFNDARLFDPRMTIATQLRGVGYTTILVGKYLNGYGYLAPQVPPGWDDFEAMDPTAYYDYSFWNNGDPTPELHGEAPSDYSTDVVAAKAVAALHRAPSGQPLFAWIAPFAPHVDGNEQSNATQPLPPPRYANDPRCAAIPGWAPPNYNERDVSDKPPPVRRAPLLSAPAFDLVPTCRTMLAVDDLVAAVRDELAREGRLDDTLLLFAGDNGMLLGAHRLNGKEKPYATDVPFSVHWPAGLGSNGRVVQDRVENIDLAPTLCALAGCRMGPYPNGQAHPDGQSFLPLLLGTASSLGRDAVIEGYPGAHGWDAIATTSASPLAHQGCALAASGGCRWHYIEYPQGWKELYDDSNGPCYAWRPTRPGDPCELTNRAGDPAYASIQRALAQRLAQLEAQNGGGDRTAPTLPRDVRAQALSPTSVRIRWSPSTDNRGIRAYSISRDGSYSALAWVGPATTQYTDTTAEPGTTYSYRVGAIDHAGNGSGQSAPATVTTPG